MFSKLSRRRFSLKKPPSEITFGAHGEKDFNYMGNLFSPFRFSQKKLKWRCPEKENLCRHNSRRRIWTWSEGRRRGCRQAPISGSEVVAGPGSIWNLTMAPASDAERPYPSAADILAPPTNHVSPPAVTKKSHFKQGVPHGVTNRVFWGTRFPGLMTG